MAFTVNSGLNSQNSLPFELKRITANGEYSGDELITIIEAQQKSSGPKIRPLLFYCLLVTTVSSIDKPSLFVDIRLFQLFIKQLQQPVFQFRALQRKLDGGFNKAIFLADIKTASVKFIGIDRLDFV